MDFVRIKGKLSILADAAKYDVSSSYQDEKWLIYDLKRKFGIYYNRVKTEYVSLELPYEMGISGANEAYFEKSEIYFQMLWCEYFNNTKIKNRANMRLHVKHLPKRNWKY